MDSVCGLGMGLRTGTMKKFLGDGNGGMRRKKRYK